MSLNPILQKVKFVVVTRVLRLDDLDRGREERGGLLVWKNEFFV